MTAFLGGGQLVFEMYTSRARFDYTFHKFEGIQHTAETRLGVCHNGQEPVDAVVPFGMMNFIGTLEAIVYFAHHRRYGIDRIQALVRIHS
ncbi:MAG: hypothetical protein MAG794_01594 [Gammaproteobacteria bacterium]|nr:hypothetical protein [Gammaproteobacteria bacterium]